LCVDDGKKQVFFLQFGFSSSNLHLQPIAIYPFIFFNQFSSFSHNLPRRVFFLCVSVLLTQKWKKSINCATDGMDVALFKGPSK
jgi:hypothetical protein